MTEKIVGYSLLGTGIFLIVAAIISVFMVFTKQSSPIQFFQMAGISLDLGQLTGVKMPSQEILPASLINDSANIFIHLMLMGFIASSGQKLASLGIELLRPIVVKLNEQK